MVMWLGVWGCIGVYGVVYGYMGMYRGGWGYIGVYSVV